MAKHVFVLTYVCQHLGPSDFLPIFKHITVFKMYGYAVFYYTN